MLLYNMQAAKAKVIVYLRNVFFRKLTSTHISLSATAKTPTKPWKDIPGPSSLPIIGQLHHFLPGGSLYTVKGMEYFERIHKTYGPIVKISSLFMPATILLFDGDAMAKVYRNENSLPVRPGFYTLAYYRKQHNKSRMRYQNSTGLASEQGELWRVVRNKVSQPMLQPNVMNVYTEVLDEVAGDLIARLKTERNLDNMLTISFLELIELWALEATGVVALGTRINSLEPNMSENALSKKLAAFMKEFFQLTIDIEFKPSLWKYYPTKSFKRLMTVYAETEKISKYYTNKAIKEVKSDKVEAVKSVFEKLVEIDENLAHIMAYDTLPAGIETTGKTTTVLLYYLATNPKKQQKLREEIYSNQGYKYMKACIKEALRLLPPFSINARETSKEHDILGYRIPKGVFVQFCHHYLSISEEQFHRPQEFIPERWIVDSNEPLYYGNAHPFAHMPFGFGYRSCVGRRVAESNIESCIKRLLQSFQIEWRGPPLKTRTSIINTLHGPYNFVFKDI